MGGLLATLRNAWKIPDLRKKMFLLFDDSNIQNGLSHCRSVFRS